MAKNRNPRFNASGCMDLTAFHAIRNADRAALRARQRKHQAQRSPQKEAQTHCKPINQHRHGLHDKSGKGNYPRVYICSPFSGDVEHNTNNALKYSRYALEKGYFPITPHLYLPRFMDDTDPDERRLALRFGLRLLQGCSEVWVFGGHISAGMAQEIEFAKTHRKSIIYFTEKCNETTNTIRLDERGQQP